MILKLLRRRFSLHYWMDDMSAGRCWAGNEDASEYRLPYCVNPKSNSTATCYDCDTTSCNACDNL